MHTILILCILVYMLPQHLQVPVLMVVQWSLVSLIPVGSVLTTLMLDVRPTTAEAVMLSTTTRGETMSLTTVQHTQVYM